MAEEQKSGSESQNKPAGEGGKRRRRRRRPRKNSGGNANNQSSANQKNQSGNNSGNNSGRKSGNSQGRQSNNGADKSDKNNRERGNSQQKRRRNNNRNNRSGQRRKKGNLTSKLSEHFTKEDFWVKDDDGRTKLKISLGLVGALELLRSRINQDIIVQKGYITPDQAEREGNWKRNFHPLGMAADIRVDGLSLEALYLAAETVENFMGIGLDVAGNHVHVDVRNHDERVQWVVKDKEEQPLTDALRQKIFKDIVCPVIEKEPEQKMDDRTENQPAVTQDVADTAPETASDVEQL